MFSLSLSTIKKQFPRALMWTKGREYSNAIVVRLEPVENDLTHVANPRRSRGHCGRGQLTIQSPGHLIGAYTLEELLETLGRCAGKSQIVLYDARAS